MPGILLIGLFLSLVIVGGFAYRWRGMDDSGFVSIMRIRAVRRVMSVGVLGMLCILLGVDWWRSLLVLAACYPGEVMGHGSYFPGGGEKIDNEPTAFITRRLFGSWLNEGGKAFGMALTGLAVTVPLTITAGLPWPAAFVGIVKPLCYLVPWWGASGSATVDAEYAWGGARVALVTVAALPFP